MAKYCEVCNNSYPDDLESCPHCAEAEVILGEEVLVEEGDDHPGSPEKPSSGVDLSEGLPEGRSSLERSEGAVPPEGSEGPAESAISDSFQSWGETPEPAEPSEEEIFIHEISPDHESGESASGVRLDAEVVSEEDIYIGEEFLGEEVGQQPVEEVGEEVVDLGEEALIEESGVSLVEQEQSFPTESGVERVDQPLTEETVALGSEPREGESGTSRRDFIAEAVESGVDLASEGDESDGSPATQQASQEEIARAMTEPEGAPTTHLAGPGEMNDLLGGTEEEAEVHSIEEEEAGVVDSAVDLGGEVGSEREVISREEIDFSAVAETETQHLGGEEEIDLEGVGSGDHGLDLAGVGQPQGVPGQGAPRQDSPPDHPPVPPPRQRSRVPMFLLGGLLGLLGGIAAAAGLMRFVPSEYQTLLGLAQESKHTTPPGKTPTQTQTPAVSSVDLLEAGQYQKAREALANIDENDMEKVAQRGQAAWLSVVKNKLGQGVDINMQNDAEVKQALADLQKAAKAPNADALFWLGHYYAMTGNIELARQTYTQGAQAFPQQRRFSAALIRLDLVPPPGLGGMSWAPRTQDRAEALELAAFLVAFQPPAGEPPAPPGGQPGAAGPPGDVEEAGFDFWDAFKAARQGNYSEAVEKIQQAHDKHSRRRFRRLGKQQNPNSDPNEDIFLRASEELARYWLLQQKILKGARDLKLAEQQDPSVAFDELVQLTANSQSALGGVVAKLMTAKVIDKPEDLGKGVDRLLTEAAGYQKVVAKLETAKVITDPAMTPDAVDGLLAQSKQLDGVLAKLTMAKVIDKPEDLARGVDQLVVEDKALTSIAGLLKGEKSEAVKGVMDLLTAQQNLKVGVAGVARDLETAAFLEKDKTDIAEVAGGVKKAIAMAMVKDPEGTIRKQEKAIEDLKAEVVATKEKAATDIKDAQARAGELVKAAEAALKERWTPQEMLTIWLPMLEETGDGKALASQAEQDVKRVLMDKDASPQDRARAQAIQGLVHCNRHEYPQAKMVLAEAQKVLGSAPPWGQVIAMSLKEATNPANAFMKNAQELMSQGEPEKALAVLDQGVKVLADDQKLAVRVYRSLVALELAETRGGVKPRDPVVGQVQADAKAAIDAGLPVGHYAMGQLAEQLRDWNGAVQAYQAALQGHPALDEEGYRYRAALARALVQRASERGASAPRAGSPAGGPPPAEAVGWKSRTRKADQGPKETPASPLRPLALVTSLFLPPVLPPEPSADEKAADKLADEILAGGDKVPFELRAQALAIKGLHTRALHTYAEGLSKSLSPQQANGLLRLLQEHPALRRPESLRIPDPVGGEKHYAVGLTRFFAEDYEQAEKELIEAIRHYNQDARYFYFLGLARWQQGKREAREDFDQGAWLERQGLPSAAAVNQALERIQGPTRRLLNEARERPQG